MIKIMGLNVNTLNDKKSIENSEISSTIYQDSI